MGNYMHSCSDGRVVLAKCDSQVDYWQMNIWNAIASKLSSEWPTDPSDSK